MPRSTPQPAPRAPRAPPALALALLLLGAAAAAPQRPPARTLPDHRGVPGRAGPPFGRVLSIVTGPQVQLTGSQYLALTGSLAQLAALGGADLVLPLFESSVGASSGGYDNPAVVGTAESSEEAADLAA